MPRANIAELRTHVLYIRRAIDKIEKHGQEVNADVAKIKEDCAALKIEMRNHLKHHANQEKGRKWFYGFIIGIVGTVTAVVNILLKIVI